MSPALPIAVSIMTHRHRSTGLTAGILAEFRAACARRSTRRTYENLLGRDDQTLSDIGVTRDDIRGALAAGL